MFRRKILIVWGFTCCLCIFGLVGIIPVARHSPLARQQGRQQDNNQNPTAAEVIARTSINRTAAEVKPGSNGNRTAAEVKPGSSGNPTAAEVKPGSNGNPTVAEVKPGSNGNRTAAEVKPGSNGNRTAAEVKPGSNGNPTAAEVNLGSNISRTAGEVKPRRVILGTTNKGFLDLTLNMLESIKRIRTPSFPNVTIIAEDQYSYDDLAKKTDIYKGLIVQKSPQGMTTSKALMVFKADYKRFVSRRPPYVLKFLESGVDVLFVDSDNYWLGDPFYDFEGDFDIAAHDEVDRPRKPLFCDGFAYYRSTENTIRLVRKWVQLMETTDKTTMDQLVFNRLINRELDRNVTGGLKMKTLNPVNYPDGRLYFSVPGWRKEHSNETTVLHFSYILGHNNKVKKLKEIGWWLV